LNYSLKGFLPLGMVFFKTVLGDINLPTWREKMMFSWVVHRMKWAIAAEERRCYFSR
jgi:hypothetical protein